MNVINLRKEFPILDQTINGKPLIYFDNAATSQKPNSVINAVSEYYETINSNVHRGIHTLSERATEAYENSREKIRRFINAESSGEIVFVKGTTEGINLVASSFGNMIIEEGDEIIISQMEHHSNMVPWQNLCSQKKALLKYIPVNEKGELILDEFKEMLNEKTKLISVVYISNSLGTINPVKEIIETAHSQNIPVILDAAQAAPHQKIDVKDLDCDFIAFSGHKMYGPTGIGILYGKEKHLEKMPPYQYGGEMIKSVSYDKTEFNVLPYKFEAGTPDISGAIGLGAAVDFIEDLGHENIHKAEMELLDHANKLFSDIGGIRIIGTAKNKASVISFVMDGIHPYDTGSILDNLGIAVRTGFHCTQPLIEERFKLPGTVRASFAVYNTLEEIDELAKGLEKVKTMLL
ncbi:MAG TPA: cysteine desulfurase [Ignavibacteria bacterium]|nr:cysteine desulfurase [Ignavibacteria bacterium]HQY52104.1 cysteine desulfurase [Ignavibacteria bacterium]HRB00806.1 cysteine desulfurase [Ignavibacteria bacterium]